MSIKAMTWAWAQDIEARDKLVLMALADHSDDDGICWPGLKGVAQKNRISERAVQRHLASLQDAGLLEVTPQYRPDGTQTTNLYRLTMSRVSPGGDKTTPGGDSTSAPRPEVSSVNLASPIGEPGVTVTVTRASPLESPSESPENLHPSSSSAREDETLWPDWYRTLREIPAMKRPFAEADAWRQAKGISEEHAETTAYALKGKWSPKEWPDPWATFQNWCKRPPLNGGSNGRPIGSPTNGAAISPRGTSSFLEEAERFKRTGSPIKRD